MNLFLNAITGRLKMVGRIHHAMRDESLVAAILPEIVHALRGQSWQPGQHYLNLSRNHYHKGAGQIKTGGGK